MKNDMTDQVAALLEQSGWSKEESQHHAAAAAERMARLDSGTSHGHLDPAALGDLWRQAAQMGKRRMLLEIVAESSALDDDTGRVNVTIVEADHWPELTPQQALERGAAIHAGPLLLPFRVPPSWQETVTELHAEGHKTPDEWDAQAMTDRTLN